MKAEIQKRLIEEEMKQSYMDYAMSVIVSRALPDARDGLKPVHRRVLYSMYELGLLSNKPSRKCARIVGDCLGKYHPHGDTAVYDALVRMAQNFSLRYPLIKGQGNFGCFTADTKVKLVDGRDLSFSELIKEHKQGKRNFTFTIDENGLVKVAEIKNPRLTRKNAEILKIVLDNGEEIKCTPNHKFMLKERSYKEAKDLEFGDSLMPAYFRLSTKEDDANAIKYNMIFQPVTNKWDFIHVLSDAWNLESGIYQNSAGRIRHHIDFNKLNNNPDNIKRMNWKEHWKTHYNFTSNKHKLDEEYKKKLAEGRKRFWSNEENRKSYSERLRKRNLKNWKNPKYRQKMTITLSDVNKKYLAEHPERIEEIRKTASITMKKMWQNSKYKELFHEKIIAANKKREHNLTGKSKFLNICSFLKENNIALNEENYEKVRVKVFGRKSFTTWDLGIKKYYNSNKNLLLCEINGNHKIIAIKFLKKFVDVYDLTIDKTHNFALASGIFVHNSVDGDAPAAMRYTEAKLSKISEDILEDLEKDTVNFVPNFDNSTKEPVVLPCKVPNLLINGSSGIAVGMATNIPPHNIQEIIDAIIKLIGNKDISIEELSEIIKGPDFPTGGIIQGRHGILEAYKNGRGKINVKAKTNFEDNKIIVTEIPYMVNKSSLIEAIADLVREKKVDGIRDIRDESDRKGMRIVIELKKDYDKETILNQLMKQTQLSTSFGMIMLALVNNEPKILSLKEMINVFVMHRKEVVTRRAKFDLNNAEQKAHILEGLKIALKNIDSVIKLIKGASDISVARTGLINTYSLTEIQANAILDMKLQRLTSLETKKLNEEYDKLVILIKELKELLGSEQKIFELIKKELSEVKEKYKDERKTEIIDREEEVYEEELVQEEDIIVTVTKDGYIKQVPLELYKQQKRGGQGIIGAEVKEEDIIENIFVTSNHNTLLFFTNKGKVHWIKAYELPEGSRYSKGKAIINILNLEEKEKVTDVLPIKEFSDKHFIIFATKKGMVKKTPLNEFSNPRKGGIIAITLKENDEVIQTRLTPGNLDFIIATKNGLAVRFNEQDISPTGRTSIGVRGIRLKDNDETTGMEVALDDAALFTITENGFGKRTSFTEYHKIRRGGSGVKNILVNERNGKVVGIKTVLENDELIIASEKGVVIRVSVKDISVIGRATQGVRVMRLKENDKVAMVARVV